MHDARLALRALRQNPIFTLVALTTLALGLGATTAIFSVVNAVLLEPLPVNEPNRVMFLRESRLPQFPSFSVSPGNFVTWRRETKTFDAMAASTSGFLILTGQGDPERLRADRTALHGDTTRAEAAAWRAVLLQEEFLSGREGQLIVGAYVRLGQVFALQGRYDEALHQFGRELEFLQRVDHALRSRIFIELHQRIGDARMRAGDSAGSKAALDMAIEAFERRLRTGADDPFTRYYAACAYALRGDTEAALLSLEKAASARRRLTVARARVEPALEGLRPLDRFQALLAATS